MLFCSIYPSVSISFDVSSGVVKIARKLSDLKWFELGLQLGWELGWELGRGLGG